MFSEIDKAMQERMSFLEKRDRQEKTEEKSRMERLRQIPPETGKFLAMLASASPPGTIVEIGTSAAYSTMWLSLAAKEKASKIFTFELLPEKIELARETIQQAKIDDLVDLIVGDALVNLQKYNDIAFAFIDFEKELYLPCWEILADKILPGGLVSADNAISHQQELEAMIAKANADNRFDCITVPVGSGIFLCRKKK